MSAFKLETDDDDDDDDIMSASTETLVVCSPDKHSTRARRSLGSTVASLAKRKRTVTLSTSALEDEDRKAALKKLKIDDRKAVRVLFAVPCLQKAHSYQITITVALRRVSIDAAKRRWLFHHRHLLVPLLPSGTTFFQHLKTDVDASTDRGTYVPHGELVEQPKSIKKGTMKGYQVSPAPRSVSPTSLILRTAPRVVLLGVDVQ
jgi:SWI/SNF-related matrix-associated actin-dependent regulator of chromatin subfamily A member 5